MPLTPRRELSEAEQHRRRRNKFVFDIFDADGSGLLDTREIKWLLPFYEAPSASFPDNPELSAVAVRGVVNLERAVECVQETLTAQHSAAGDAAYCDDGDFGLHWIVTAADEDHDGKVSKREWLHFLEATQACAVWRLPGCCRCVNIINVPCMPDCIAARYFYFWGHSSDLISRSATGLKDFVVGGSVHEAEAGEADEDLEVDGRERACFNCNTPSTILASKIVTMLIRGALVIATVVVGFRSIAHYATFVAKSVLRLAIGRAFLMDMIDKVATDAWRGNRTCAVDGECTGTCGAPVQSGWLSFMEHSALCSDVSAADRDRELKLTTAVIVVLPVVWYGLRQLIEFLPCCTRQHGKTSIHIVLFLIAVALVEYWSELIDWDSKLKVSASECSRLRPRGTSRCLEVPRGSSTTYLEVILYTSFESFSPCCTRLVSLAPGASSQYLSSQSQIF